MPIRPSMWEDPCFSGQAGSGLTLAAPDIRPKFPQDYRDPNRSPETGHRDVLPEHAGDSSASTTLHNVHYRHFMKRGGQPSESGLSCDSKHVIPRAARLRLLLATSACIFIVTSGLRSAGGPGPSRRQDEPDQAPCQRGRQSGVDSGHQLVVPFGFAAHADRLRASGEAAAAHPPPDAGYPPPNSGRPLRALRRAQR
jgi:hypothetical protein